MFRCRRSRAGDKVGLGHAIILSVGYGKDMTGRVPLRFGPVNQQGGERRINVAASRARSRMTVVSSINSGDFDPSALTKGPKLLQALLRFAETGGADIASTATSHPLNAFELAVQYELEQVGLEPLCQYGASGFRIDFVIPHPCKRWTHGSRSRSGRSELPLESTARDRDRLRQQVLEDKGWRFHRIWSTAFFKDPKKETALAKTAYDKALRAEEELNAQQAEAASAAPQAKSPAEPAAVARPRAPSTERTAGPKPVVHRRLPIDEQRPSELVHSFAGSPAMAKN